MRKKVLSVLCVAAIVCLGVALSDLAGADTALRTSSAQSSSVQSAVSRPTASETSEIVQQVSRTECYLLVGMDENGLTDTVIAAFCGYSDNSVKLLCIPRDTYVGGGIPTGKINAVYARATRPYPAKRDMRNLMAWVESNLGIKTDGYVAATIEGFRKAVDAVGGIPVTVTSTMYDPKQGVTVFEPGEYVLDGHRALEFVSFRSGYVYGDLGRVEAQKRFLAAALAKISELDSTTLLSAAAAQLSEGFESDMPLAKLLRIVQFVRGAGADNVFGCTLPGTQFTSAEGLSCYAVDRQKLLDLLNGSFYTPEEAITLADIGAPEVDNADPYDAYSEHRLDFSSLTR